MDELTLLRSTRDDTLEPSPGALNAGRATLLDRWTCRNRSLPAPTSMVRPPRWCAGKLFGVS